MRIAVADDHELFRAGVAAVLRQAGFTVVIEAGDGDELLARAEADPPDVALLDLRMPPTFTDEGVRTAAALRARMPRIGVLLLSMYSEAEYAATLLELGDHGVGYLLKDRITSARKLASEVLRVADGDCVIDSEITRSLLARRRPRRAVDQLSPRLQDVLGLVAQGRSNIGIAATLCVQVSTVEKYINEIFRVLDIDRAPESNRRVAAVLSWLQDGGPVR